ncbi:MAG: hypothetical protein ACO2O0_04440 [Desulfurococcales archaeon]
MGRTAPSLRMGVEGELDRLRKIFSSIEDPELREAALESLEGAVKLYNAFQRSPSSDPLEVILFSLIVELYRRLRKSCGR